VTKVYTCVVKYGAMVAPKKIYIEFVRAVMLSGDTFYGDQLVLLVKS
jgi:hypothetical protein